MRNESCINLPYLGALIRMHMCTIGNWLRKLTIVSACLVFPLSEALALPVIPGAAGFGMDTPAGRGGKVYKVTNLNATGSGSLRECIEASGPRVCVFEVSGTIRLEDTIRISNPYITIAGQTAPSPGITIRGAGIRIRTSHVLIQHLRIRPGDDPNGPKPTNRDAIYIGDNTDVEMTGIVLDHNSFSWGMGQIASTWANNKRVTFRNNIFAEGIWTGEIRGRGPVIRGRETSQTTMVGNLFVNNMARNPLSRAGHLVLVNNVFYNWGNVGTDLQGEHGIVTRNTLIGNYYKAGPDSSRDAIRMRGRGDDRDMTPGSKVYVRDNIAPRYDGNDPWSAVSVESALDDSFKASTPPTWNTGLQVRSAREAYDQALTYVGARPADRDAVDVRLVKEVQNGHGQIIASQDDVGGWPNLAQNRRELTLPSNPNADSNGNGYTDLEEWLHRMAAAVEGRGVAPAAPSGLTVR